MYSFPYFILPLFVSVIVGMVCFALLPVAAFVLPWLLSKLDDAARDRH